MDPQISYFNNFFIKNGSHDTIYTFKNYFAIVISAISFQFQQNKSYPNRPIKLYKNLIQFKPFLHKVKVSDLREIINKHKKIPKPKYEGTFMGSQISE